MDDYFAWKRVVTAKLREAGLFETIEGDVLAETATEQEIYDNKRKNSTVKPLLVDSIDADCLPRLKEAGWDISSSAKATWEAIGVIAQRMSNAEINQTLQYFLRLDKGKFHTLGAYVTATWRLWNRIKYKWPGTPDEMLLNIALKDIQHTNPD